MAEKNFKLVDERYLILRKLGNGKLCEVFEVLDLENQAIFAGKRYSLSTYSDLSDKFKETVFTEINILRQIDNPHVLRCWEVVFTVDSFYLMLTYCGFGSLQNHIANQDNFRLPQSCAVDFLRQIIHGYRALYAMGIVHGDIKSENLFMKSEGHLLIGDLNTSKSNLKASGIMGTELYSPPFKKSWGVRHYQHDVWSIGVVFFEMLFGIEEWYMNFTNRTFGERLVYPRSKELGNAIKFLVSKFLDPAHALTLHQMLEQLKFIRDPLNQEIRIEFSGSLLSAFKDFERKIGEFDQEPSPTRTTCSASTRAAVSATRATVRTSWSRSTTSSPRPSPWARTALPPSTAPRPTATRNPPRDSDCSPKSRSPRWTCSARKRASAISASSRPWSSS